MNNLVFGVLILFCWFNWIKSRNFAAYKPLMSIAQAMKEDKKLNEKEFHHKGAYFVPTSHKKQPLLLSSPAGVMAELLQLSSSGPVEILREEQIRNAKEVVEKIQKAGLRASACRKGAIKACKKACKNALKNACTVYKCRSKLKSQFRKQCKSNCKSEFGNM